MRVPLGKLDGWGLERSIFYLVPTGRTRARVPLRRAVRLRRPSPGAGTAHSHPAFPSVAGHDGAARETSMGNLLRILIAIFLPPVGAFMAVGLGLHFWLNILLTLAGGLPGSVHALWLFMRTR